tara:strand:+ start:505 stop:1797 length:1293 start_codon:yes stop_codon:yes gene_type:complete
MMSFNYKKFYNYEELIFLFFYFTILLGYFFNEDTLGGARPDFLYHYRISESFNNNFSQTFKLFGNTTTGSVFNTRNSPIFWIIIGFFDKVFSLEIIRFLNSIISLLIAIFFLKCLTLKFKDQKKISLILLSSVVFLSPTIRSLSVWPYSLTWGLLFFIISIYYFLKLEDKLNAKINFIISLKLLFFLILSSYIYPSFGIFFLYFACHIYQKIKFSKYLFFLFFYSLILSIPAIYYILDTNMLSSFTAAQGVKVSNAQAYNLSNKIMIIFTMFLFFVLPVLNFKKIFIYTFKINFKIFLLIFLFTILNIYFFNFPFIDGGRWGGGFFHKLSNMLFDNNFIFYGVFILSLIISYSVLSKNWNNYLLLLLLILFNPQFTIYHKYYDPLIFILFLTLFEFNMKEHFFNKKYKYLQLFFFSGGYLMLALLKNYVL